MQELAGDDVLELMRQDLLNSSFVSVKGVRLGDSAETVITKRGKPVFSESPDAGLLNLRFENAAKVTDMIVHLENGTVTRIAVKEGMSPVLVNRSKMEYRKEDVTRALGKPDKIYDTKYYHIFEYHPLGLEVYFKAKKMVGFGFVPPK